jgi:D-threo-aldose 1-dehydrogenase
LLKRFSFIQPEMVYHEIRNTGLKIPQVIFGTSALGNLYQAFPEEKKSAIIKESFQNVENPVFDCAGKYGAGLALEMLGKFLQALDIKPCEVVISNKLGWLRKPLSGTEPTFEPGVWCDLEFDAVQAISYNGIISCWEQGNELLGGYLPQLVSVHDPDEYLDEAKDEKESEKRFTDILEAYTALDELKKKGHVKAVGVGAKNWRVIEKICRFVDLDWVMFANSMTIMKHPDDLLGFMKSLQEKGVGIINSAVFHAGFLTGGTYFDYKYIQPDTDENKAIFKWRDDFFAVCKKFNVLPASACVAFAMSAPGVIGISLNTSDPDRVKRNVESVTPGIPGDFWREMKVKGLIDPSYSYI